jgi:hypothetical protein
MRSTSPDPQRWKAPAPAGVAAAAAAAGSRLPRWPLPESRRAPAALLALLAPMVSLGPLVPLGLAAAGGLAAAPPAAAAPYLDGDRVQFTGLVTDAAGKPLPGVQVALEAAHKYISWRELRRATKDVRRVSATTDARGEYTIEWPWDDYYDHFEVLAGVSVRHGREESLQALERVDVTERVDAGSPVVSAIVVHNRALVDRVREFVASVESADERRVYEEMGTPDDVKRMNYAGRPREGEVSWWYFEAGKVFRFRNGRLEQVDRFEPVQRF